MNKPTKIFCIMGMMGSGKDTLAREVEKNIEDIHLLVSHTTRPIRPNEEEGKAYYFIDNVKFLKMKEANGFVETRTYYTKVEKDGDTKDATWYYGLSYDEINKYKYSMFIVDYPGYKEIKEKYGKNVVVPIYINVPIEQLRERALKRQDFIDEINRRLIADEENFKELKVRVVYKKIDNSNGNFENALNELVRYIKEMMK